MTASGSFPSAAGIVVLLLLATGCLTSRSAVDFPDHEGRAGESLGEIEVVSGVLGSRTLAPESCSSGDRQFFLGGDFGDASSGTVVRLVVDPVEGPVVRVFESNAPFEHDVVFSRSECGLFHFTLEPTGWRVNDVYDYQITLEVDCERSGELVKGRLATSHCH